MSRTIDTKEYLDTVVSLLQEGRKNIPVSVSGVSMTPFLHPGDTVFLNLPQRACRKGDIVLFTRSDGRYILHRIVRKYDESYLLLGDSQIAKEFVPAERICAVVTAIRIGEKVYTSAHPYCLFFRTVWRWFAPFRPQIGKILNFIKHKKSR